MKICNFVLSMAIIAVIIALFTVLFLPYYKYTPEVTTLNPNPVETEVSLMDFVWVKPTALKNTFSEALKDAGVIEKKKDYYINDYVMGIIAVTVATAFAVVALICSRRSPVGIVASLLWAAFCVWTFFVPNPLLQLGDTATSATVMSTCRILTLAGTALSVIRIFPWLSVTKRRKATQGVK